MCDRQSTRRNPRPGAVVLSGSVKRDAATCDGRRQGRVALRARSCFLEVGALGAVYLPELVGPGACLARRPVRSVGNGRPRVRPDGCCRDGMPGLFCRHGSLLDSSPGVRRSCSLRWTGPCRCVSVLVRVGLTHPPCQHAGKDNPVIEEVAGKGFAMKAQTARRQGTRFRKRRLSDRVGKGLPSVAGSGTRSGHGRLVFRACV